MTGNMIGRIFNNRYKITDRVGIGGMAEVYRAQDSVLGRVVAVKTMLPQYAADPSFTQRFKQEAASAANLQSPYIVNVYDWGQDEGTYYIVMEYVRGSDLKTAILERGAINQRKVAEIGSQVCQALSAAHKLDIIHRDIKPQNIMVQPDGNVKVMDFGIARAKNSVKTQTSSVLGTAHYISPEQAQGKELTPASDIYSLGIVLYEAATGKLPFDGPDAISVAMKQVNDNPALPSEINPDIDPDLEMIIMKALEKRPIDRFATANDMRLILNDYLAGRPIDLGGTFGAAETAIMGGIAGAAIVGGGAPTATSVMPAVQNGVKPTNPATSYRSNDDNEKKPNKKTIAIVLGVIAALLLVGGITWAILNAGPSGDIVPDITGKTVEVATQQLEDDGYKLGKQDTAFNDNVEEGKIISQDPAGGTEAAKGTTVNVVVSSGKEKVTVPNLTNMTADEARKKLDELGLTASPGTAEHSDTIELNHVVRQDPASGTEVRKGDKVTYILSLGIGNGAVPNVLGNSEADATKTLTDAGFKVDVQTGDYSSEYNEGQVMNQNPSAGSSMEKGTTVTIFISKGPEPEPDPEIPYVVDLYRDNAVNSLKAAGFEVKEETAYDDNVESGKVISQDKSGTASKGTTITIVVSKGPDPANETEDKDDTTQTNNDQKKKNE